MIFPRTALTEYHLFLKLFLIISAIFLHVPVNNMEQNVYNNVVASFMASSNPVSSSEIHVTVRKIIKTTSGSQDDFT